MEPDLLSLDNVVLTAHGLDTIGQVFLNHQLVGSSDNMFVRYMWPVKSILKVKNNLIQVRFSSAPEYAKQRYLDSRYIIPPGKGSALKEYFTFRLSF